MSDDDYEFVRMLQFWLFIMLMIFLLSILKDIPFLSKYNREERIKQELFKKIDEENWQNMPK
jgi:hypothetical protein